MLQLSDICGASDAGTVRPSNEDHYLIDAGLGLAAIADGMGGHQAGEEASSMALAALHRFLLEQDETGSAASRGDDPDATAIDAALQHSATMLRAVLHANGQVYAANQAQGQREGCGMGTTLTGLRCLPAAAAIVVFHVGDTRLYACRDGRLLQLTRDQTAYQAALESGSGGTLPPQNMLLQAVGPHASVMPEVQLHALQADELLMLCSDGLHGWVPHEEMAAALHSGQPLQQMAEALIALAKQHSSRDNITVVLARCAATGERS